MQESTSLAKGVLGLLDYTYILKHGIYAAPNLDVHLIAKITTLDSKRCFSSIRYLTVSMKQNPNYSNVWNAKASSDTSFNFQD